MITAIYCPHYEPQIISWKFWLSIKTEKKIWKCKLLKYIYRFFSVFLYYSEFSLFDQQIFDHFEKNISFNENFNFWGDFQEIFFKLKIPGDWNGIPGDFQEVATLISFLEGMSCLKYHFWQILFRLKHSMIKSEISVSDLSNFLTYRILNIWATPG